MNNNEPRPVRYIGESADGYDRRLADWEAVDREAEAQKAEAERLRTERINNNEKVSDADLHARQQALTLAAMRKRNAEPLLSEVIRVSGTGGTAYVLVSHKPRRVAPSEHDQAYLPGENFYRVCDEADAVITLMPDELSGRSGKQCLKRVDAVEVGMRGRLWNALTNHPLMCAPVNWIFVVDDSLDDSATGTAVEAAAEVAAVTGTVVGITGAGGGYVMVSIELDNGGIVTASTSFSAAPTKGAHGTVSYNEDNEPVFAPDAADEPSGGTGSENRDRKPVDRDGE